MEQLSPRELQAIGLFVIIAVQVLKLGGVKSVWAPPIGLLIGGLLGVFTAYLKGWDASNWLVYFGDGATGGFIGAGMYSSTGAMKELLSKLLNQGTPDDPTN